MYPLSDVASPAPFSEKTLSGVTFRVASDPLRSSFQTDLVGWKVRDSQILGLGHEDPPVIEQERTEVARLTPYTEGTGPRDVGDGYRWSEYRRQLGRGLIVEPPIGWQPGDKIINATQGEMTIVATEDFAEVANRASQGKRGFVLVEPSQGWKNIESTSIDEDRLSTKTLVLIAAVLGAVAAGIAWMDRRGRK